MTLTSVWKNDQVAEVVFDLQLITVKFQKKVNPTMFSKYCALTKFTAEAIAKQ